MTQDTDETRSAEAERVRLALSAAGYGPLRHVEVTVQAGAVFLTGQVPSYHLKQLAQEAALAALATHRVRNDLAVARPG